MKKGLSVLLAVLLALSLTGCARIERVLDRVLTPTTDGDTATTTERVTTTTSAGGIFATDGYAEGRLGDVMHTYFFDYTVNSAYTCAAFDSYTPNSGHSLLVAEITVKNTGRTSIEMYDTDFQVQWGEGDEDYGYPLTLSAGNPFPDTYELGINEERTGLLVFEIPEGKKDFSISYLEVFSDDTEGDTFFVYFTATSKAD